MRKFFGPNDQGRGDHSYDPSKNEHNTIHDGVIDGSLSGAEMFPEYAVGGIDDIPPELLMGIFRNKSSKLSAWGVSILPHIGLEDHRRRINDYGRDLYRQMREDGYSDDTSRWARAWMFTRFQDRCKLNQEKFSAASGKVPELLHDELEASVRGEASPVTLLAIKSFRGMDSIELGRVTLPAIRQEVVQDMDMGVAQAIDMMGGETCEPDIEFNIAESRSTSDGKFVNLITVKERMALLPDGTIVAKRSTFVVETNKEISLDDVTSLFDGSDTDHLPSVALSVICYAYSKTNT